MRKSKAPVVATWLLLHFGSNPKNEIVAGDLLEHYHEGRSAWWYWRQVLIAISGFANVSLFVVARVMIVGWLMALNVLPIMIRHITPHPLNAETIGAALFVTGIVTGALLGLLNRPDHLAAMTIFSASYLAKALFRLFIVPGIQMDHKGQLIYGRMYYVDATAFNVLFVIGVLTAGILLAYHARAAEEQPEVAE